MGTSTASDSGVIREENDDDKMNGNTETQNSIDVSLQNNTLECWREKVAHFSNF